uniref:Uncharacterized protein n=1 Tax=Arundo donax TaxID=35708 RepID=A0A0A9HK46_ARUDO
MNYTHIKYHIRSKIKGYTVTYVLCIWQ